MSGEMSKTLEKKLSQLQSKYTESSKETTFVSTGSIIADSVLVDSKIVKGEPGLPLGKFIEIFGDSGTGKSTFILHACKTACSKGHRVLYLDYEGGVNESQLEGIGLTKYLGNKFFLFPIDTFEEAEEIIDELKDEGFTYIVIDSITAMMPAKLKEKSVGDLEPGLQARYTSNFLQKYKSVVKHRDLSFIFVNQIRTKLNFRGMSSVESAGGYAIKFYMDIRLKLRKVKKLEKTMDTLEGRVSVEYGCEAALSAIKNRYNKPFIEGVLHIIYGKGISNLSSYFRWLQNNGFVKQGGAGWFTIEFPGIEPVKIRGSVEVLNWVKSNLKMVQDYIESHGGFLLVSEVEEE